MSIDLSESCIVEDLAHPGMIELPKRSEGCEKEAPRVEGCKLAAGPSTKLHPFREIV